MTTAFLLVAAAMYSPPTADLSPMRAVAAAVVIAEQHPTPEALRFVFVPDYSAYDESYPSQRECVDVASFCANASMGHGPLIYPCQGGGFIVTVNLFDMAFGDLIAFDRLAATHDKLHSHTSLFFVEIEGKLVIHPAMADSYLRLSELTASVVPMIRYDDFVALSMSTINGGLYYDYRGFETGKTKQADWHAAHFSFRTTAAQALSLRAAYQQGSLVTGQDNDRVVQYWPSNRGKDGIGIPVFSTDDVFDENAGRVDYDPFRRPLAYKSDGHEDIAVLANGLQSYAMFDVNKLLVASVPEQIARDYTVAIPGGGTNILHIRGCVVCHSTESEGVAADGSIIYPNGYRSLRDDLSPLLRTTNLVADLSQADQTAALGTLESFVRGDLNEALGAARQSYRVAVSECTGGRMTVEKLGTVFAKIHDERWWGVVSPEQAAIEIGYGDRTLAEALPSWMTDPNTPPDRLRRIHPRIMNLLSGKSIPRSQFRSVVGELANLAWLNDEDLSDINEGEAQ